MGQDGEVIVCVSHRVKIRMFELGGECWIIQTFLRATSVKLRLSFVYIGSDQRCRIIRLEESG